MVDGILDNPDPANLIQRAIVTDGNLKIIDNIPVAKARELFEQGVKSTQDPIIAELKRKAWENKDYEPSEEELAAVKAWAASPDIILTEEQLQRIYEFPAGSESYLQLYNFTSEQAGTLRKIKDAFVANLSSQGRVDIDAIFANPIYARLIGSFEQINQRFDGRLKDIVAEMQKTFKTAA